MELLELDIRSLITIGILIIAISFGLWLFFRVNRRDREKLTEKLNHPDLVQRRKNSADDPEDVRHQ